jgi:hypothetical protein
VREFQWFLREHEAQLRRAVPFAGGLVLIVIAVVIVALTRSNASTSKPDAASQEVPVSATPFPSLTAPATTPVPSVPASPAATGSASAAASPTSAAVKSQSELTTWLRAGGQSALSRASAAAAQLETAVSGKSPTALTAACADIQTAVNQARAVGPLPGAQTTWAGALTEVSNASSECIHGVDTGSASELAQAQRDAKAGIADAESALAAASRA